MSAIDENFDRVRGYLAATQSQMTRTVGGFATGLLGVLSAAVLTQL